MELMQGCTTEIRDIHGSDQLALVRKSNASEDGGDGTRESARLILAMECYIFTAD